MNYRTINKSNTLVSLLKVSNANQSNFTFSFDKLLQKLKSFSNYLFNNEPYVFDDSANKNTVYHSYKGSNYNTNTDLRLIEVRRTFL